MSNMSVSITSVNFESLQAFRAKYHEEMACQIVKDSLHHRPGWAEWYRLRLGNVEVGYAAVLIGGPWAGTRALFEAYVLPQHRVALFDLFDALVVEARIDHIQAQTNDRLLSILLLQCYRDLKVEKLVFSDCVQTHLPDGGAIFRRLTESERMHVFKHHAEPVGEWGLECAGEIVATGGYLGHYNPPHVDIYMEVRRDVRRHGHGSYLVQEIKRIAYSEQKIPCARCNIDNIGSRKTIARAGMMPCAHIILGAIGRDDRPVVAHL